MSITFTLKIKPLNPHIKQAKDYEYKYNVFNGYNIFRNFFLETI